MNFNSLDYSVNNAGILEYPCPNCGNGLVGLRILVEDKCFSCGSRFEVKIEEVENE